MEERLIIHAAFRTQMCGDHFIVNKQRNSMHWVMISDPKHELNLFYEAKFPNPIPQLWDCDMDR